MTVSYQYQVASSTSGGFTRLLLMWRGSLYKLIYRELLLYLLLFGIMSALYRHAFTSAQKREFEKIVVYCDTLIKLIPLSFVLGFYVSYVAQRWWKQYKAIPWPDKVMHLVALYITGNDEYSRMLRRALMRYLNLSLILVLRSISSAVKRRFPTLDHVVDSGFMTTLELELYQSVPSVEFNTYWIPCTWFINLLKEARKSHRLPDAQGLKIIMEEFNEFRTKCGLLWSYDWVSIPLVYTQVVTLATYSFFVVALIGRQYIDGSAKPFQLKIDKYLPIFTILQFFFFMGLLKVAEQLINPFGDDDEDFELNWLIDRHIKVSYLGVDTLMNRCPPLVKDIYYDFENLILPYTEAAAAYKKETYRGSVANMTVPEEKQMMFLPRIVEEEEEENKRTPRTSSTANLTNPSDSPVNERRQISESPPMPLAWKVARNCAETVVQLDGQEQPVEPEQRRVLIEAVKRFSSLAKGSTARSESRKAFFPIFAKSSSKPPLQPWPSAANISRSSQSGTSAFELDGPWAKDTFKDADRRPSENSEGQPSISSQSEMDQEGVVNSAFSSEKLENVTDVCECEDHIWEEEHISESASPMCQCREQESHQQLPAAGTTDVSRFDIDESRQCSPIGSYPRYLIRRDRSTGGSRRRKGIQWRPMMPRKSQKFRRRTTGNVPGIETILSQTRSSPNLSNLEEQAGDALEVAKIDPSCTQESVSKL